MVVGMSVVLVGGRGGGNESVVLVGGHGGGDECGVGGDECGVGGWAWWWG